MICRRQRRIEEEFERMLEYDSVVNIAVRMRRNDTTEFAGRIKVGTYIDR